MSREKREKHFKKVAHCQAKLTCSDNVSDAAEYSNTLPVDPTLFQNGLSIPLPSVQAIWNKAAELVSQPDSIVSAPGYSNES